MKNFEEIKLDLIEKQHVWLITGVAGFIGSNLLELLLNLNQKVVGLDNFSTGFQHNLDEVRAEVSEEKWDNFTFVEGDIRDFETCNSVVKGVDYVLHQAALGSVPRSIADPITSNSANVTGFLNMLHAAKEHKVKNFVYAASSSTYGDHPSLPKIEDRIGNPLSPYAVTKYVNELYANVYAKTYGFNVIGLRYFNVFGPRQNPDGAYAAVIPKWIQKLINNDLITINGDGTTSRDFCFIKNVLEANILASINGQDLESSEVFNVALGDRTNLVELLELIKGCLKTQGKPSSSEIEFKDFRAGDVKHSQADISKITDTLNYKAIYKVQQGLAESVTWYLAKEGNYS